MSIDEKSTSGIRKEVDAIVKKMDADNMLSAKDRERLQELADTGDQWARYQFSRYLFSIADKTDNAIEIWQSLADEKYPLAMANLGDYYFHENAPENWDLSYANYTGEGAMPLSDSGKTAVKDILNHGKFNKRVLIMSIVFCVISVVLMLLTSSFAIFHINPVLRIILIVLEALVIIQGIRKYRFNSFGSLRWMLPDLLLIWCIYLFIWLI